MTDAADATATPADPTREPEVAPFGPTGRRIHLAAGRVEAEVGTVAALLCRVTVDGVDLVEPVPAETAPPFGNGTVLVPWPNRVRDGIWTLDGTRQQLDLTEPARHNALHGLLAFTDYEVREQGDAFVVLGATIHPQHGWPFLVDTWVRYELTADGVAVTHGAENRSTAAAPYAVGTHPFLRVGDVPVDTLTLTVPAPSYVDVDERLNPVATVPVDGTRFDLRHGPLVADVELDTAYAAVEHADGASAWLTAPDGSRTELVQDADWAYVQVFTTPIFPDQDGAGGVHRAIAIEPMTAPPDALNSGDGLVWIEPGATWSGSWGLRYRA